MSNPIMPSQKPNLGAMLNAGGAPASPDAGSPVAMQGVPSASAAQGPPPVQPTGEAAPAAPQYQQPYSQPGAPAAPVPQQPQQQGFYTQPAPQQPVQQQPAAQPYTQPGAPAAPQMTALPQQPQAPPQQPGQAPAIIEHLRQKGFKIDNTWSEDEIWESVATQLDEANAIRERFGQQTQPPQPVQQQPAAPGMQPKTPVQQPAAPATPDTAPSQFRLSHDAIELANSGLVHKNDQGQWVADNPTFQSFADEHNRMEAHRAATANRLLSDFDGVLTESAKNIGLVDKSSFDQMREELTQLRDSITSERNQLSQSRLNDWVSTNAQHLFTDATRRQLTPYGQQLNKAAEQIESLAQSMGQELPPGEIHNRALQIVGGPPQGQQGQAPSPQMIQQQPQPQQPAGQYQPLPQTQQTTSNPYFGQISAEEPPSPFSQTVGQAAQQPPPPMQSTPAPQAPPQQSFMQQAAQTPPRAPQNRLTEYPAQQSTGIQYIPTGKGGRPDLGALIAANSGMNNGQMF